MVNGKRDFLAVDIKGLNKRRAVFGVIKQRGIIFIEWRVTGIKHTCSTHRCDAISAINQTNSNFVSTDTTTARINHRIFITWRLYSVQRFCKFNDGALCIPAVVLKLHQADYISVHGIECRNDFRGLHIKCVSAWGTTGRREAATHTIAIKEVKNIHTHNHQVRLLRYLRRQCAWVCRINGDRRWNNRVVITESVHHTTECRHGIANTNWVIRRKARVIRKRNKFRIRRRNTVINQQRVQHPVWLCRQRFG